MESLIEKGRHSYGAHKYEDALEHFTRAMKLCSCTRGIKRKRCLCKDFEGVVAKGGSVFVEAMYTCVCDVGKIFNKCDNPLHIKALDYRAATYEMLHLLNRAAKDAGWMLELAPRLPDGYLRLGKVARLRDDAEFARSIYDAGVEACKGGAADFPVKFEKLHRSLRLLQQRFRRKDPMHLPIEIAHEIFSRLSVVELTRCLRVSRTWKRFLETRVSRRLWRSLVFERSPRKPLSNVDFSILVHRSGGDVRHAVIADPDDFHISWQKMTTLLLNCPNIERLVIGGGADEYYHLMPKGHSYPKLRHLSLESHLPWEARSKVLKSHGLGGVPVDFIKNVAGSLEFLALGAVPPSLCQRTPSPVFTNLKHLRLDDKFLTADKPALPIFAVAVKTPNLEQLYLTNSHINYDRQHLWKDEWHTLWSRLRVFFFGMPIRGWAAQVEASASTVTLINSLRSGADLEHLDFDIAGGNAEQDPGADEVFTVAPNLDQYGITDAEGRSVLRARQFPNLRSLGLRNFVAVPERMGQIFGETVRSGKLHTYDIVFPLPDLEGRTGRECVNYLGGYAWLRGLESIRHLGVSRFCFRELATGDDDMPLPGFIASFPNLETLSISSDYCSVEDFCYIVEATLKATRLETLYQNCAKGAMMDCIQEMAASHGVKHVYGERPRVWPVPLDN